MVDDVLGDAGAQVHGHWRRGHGSNRRGSDHGHRDVGGSWHMGGDDGSLGLNGLLGARHCGGKKGLRCVALVVWFGGARLSLCWLQCASIKRRRGA